MKLLYVISTTHLDGATLSFLSLIKGMREKGAQLIIVIPDSRNELLGILDNLKLKYYKIPFTYRSYPNIDGISSFFKFGYRLIKRVYVNIKAKNRLVKIMRLEKPNIVHTNVGPLHIGYEACLKTKIPHVWHIREYGDLDFKIYEFPSKHAFHRRLKNSYVITITKALLEYNHLKESYKHRVIYNGVRRKTETSFSNRKEKFFLCASRVSKEKGHERIIKIFSIFYQSHPDYKLVILGNGDINFIKELKQQSKILGCGDAVEFMGFQQNVSDYMYKAKALLVASPAEGFGRMTAEAAFNGCIVIGMNTGGTKEILNIIGGYSYINDQEMLNAMKEVVLLTEEKYKEIALRSQKNAQEFFSEESYIDKIYNFYNDIIVD